MPDLHSPEDSPLGKPSAYVTHYDPSLLFPIGRQGKRDELGLKGTLPFYGVDIWNAYEVSWLNLRGKPQVVEAEPIAQADPVPGLKMPYQNRSECEDKTGADAQRKRRQRSRRVGS